MNDPSIALRDKIEALRTSYAKGLPGKMAELETSASQLKSTSTLEDAREPLAALRGFAHKLSGSGGAFGFASLSEIARDLERLCDAVLDGERVYSPPLREEIETLVRGLKSETDSAVGTAMPGSPPSNTRARRTFS